METKSNESTDLRPEGARLLNAPLVTIDIPELLQKIKAEATWQNSDRNAMTVYKTNGMRIVLLALHAGAELKEHTAEGIISVQVMDGAITFNAEGQSVVLKKGQMIALHKGLPHSVKANEESVFLLTLTTSLEK